MAEPPIHTCTMARVRAVQHRYCVPGFEYKLRGEEFKPRERKSSSSDLSTHIKNARGFAKI